MNAILPGSFERFAALNDIKVGSELIVDSFAGGGGASTGIRRALERLRALGLVDDDTPEDVSVAINHNAAAIAMHQANHPFTMHMTADIWSVDPCTVTGGKSVGAMWASPDCRDFSRAKAGQPVDGKVRGLAWVVNHWAERVRPKLILLENVEEFLDWGPLIARSDGKMIPDKSRRGETFREWLSRFKALGYTVEWRKLYACDYGAPTIRKRLYVIMRCDGKPIVWPEATHAAWNDPRVTSGELQPFKTALDVVDFDRPAPSIFMTAQEARTFKKETGIQVRRPLVFNTMRRIAIGTLRYAIKASDPAFVVCCNHGGDGFRGHGINEPLKTVTAARDAYGLVVPFIAMMRNSGKPTTAINEPIHTVTATGAFPSLIEARLAAPFMMNMKGSDRRDSPITAPVSTICAQGGHASVVSPLLAAVPLTPELYERAKIVANFLREYGVWDEGEVVTVGGYVIYDIGLRMLTTRELARAQGFGDDYILDAPHEGRILTDEEQRHKIGNAVVPDVAEALVFANFRPERRGDRDPDQEWLLDRAA